MLLRKITKQRILKKKKVKNKYPSSLLLGLKFSGQPRIMKRLDDSGAVTEVSHFLVTGALVLKLSAVTTGKTSGQHLRIWFE